MPNSNIINPHLKVPFKFSEGSALCVEQNSEDDVAQCVSAIVRTVKGFRLEIPEFGIEDPALQENGPDLHAIEAAIDAWEPRAVEKLTAKQLEDILSRELDIEVGVRADA